MQAANAAAQEQEQVNTTLMIEKGSVDADNELKLTRCREHLSGLEKHVQSIAESLDRPMPDFKTKTQKAEEAVTTSFIAAGVPAAEIAAATGGTMSVAGAVAGAGAVVNAGGMVLGIVADPSMRWIDDSEAKFYEDILDLKDVVPEKYLGLLPKDPYANERTADLDTGKFDVFVDKLACCDRVGQLNELAMTFAHDWNTKVQLKYYFMMIMLIFILNLIFLFLLIIKLYSLKA